MIYTQDVNRHTVHTDESGCVLITDRDRGYTATVTDIERLVGALLEAREYVRHDGHEEAHPWCMACESGTSSPAMLAALTLSLVPVSLLLVFVARLAGAVAGVAA